MEGHILGYSNGSGGTGEGDRYLHQKKQGLVHKPTYI